MLCENQKREYLLLVVFIDILLWKNTCAPAEFSCIVIKFPQITYYFTSFNSSTTLVRQPLTWGLNPIFIKKSPE